MGGCLSKKGLSAHRGKKRGKGERAKEKHLDRDTPPSSPPEDEAVVKEVLTETPTPCVVAAGPDSRGAEAPAKVVKPPGKVGAAAPPGSFGGRRHGLEGASEGDEEASEIYSASESFSAVSTAQTEKKDAGAGELLEEETSSLRKGPPKRRPADGSPAVNSYQQRNRYASGRFSPKGDPKLGPGGGSGRSSPSPVRRPTNGRTFAGSGRDAACTSRHHARNGISSPAGAVRPDCCERTGRGRSASPSAKRAAAGGGSRRGGAPGRTSPFRRVPGPRLASPGRTPAREHPCGLQMATLSGSVAEAEEGDYPTMPPTPVPEEMLENPLVSLECFIFL